MPRALQIVEIGGGRGRLAEDILKFFCESKRTDVYEHMRYTIVEISPALACLQEELLQPWIDDGRCHVVCDDAISWMQNWRTAEKANTIVHLLGMEILDNFAHDLVKRDRDGNLFQAHVYVDGNSALSDRHDRLQWSGAVDPGILKAMDAYGMLSTQNQSWLESACKVMESAMGQSEEFWVPTACYDLLGAIAHNVKGDYALTLADFSQLPGASSGANGPVVQRVERGKCVVYPTVSDAPMGRCDIMFPTNFPALSRAFWNCKTERDGSDEVLTHKEFFRKYADDEDMRRSTCADGYNPVLSEFANQSVVAIDVSCGQVDTTIK
jgi:SAM-dependent MidA family methyltransferase